MEDGKVVCDRIDSGYCIVLYCIVVLFNVISRCVTCKYLCVLTGWVICLYNNIAH